VRHRRRPTEVRIFRLGEEPLDDLRATTTAEERLEMVRRLTERAWALSGRPFPSYSRDRIPVRITTRE
jgi:hypothetical protein